MRRRGSRRSPSTSKPTKGATASRRGPKNHHRPALLSSIGFAGVMMAFHLQVLLVLVSLHATPVDCGFIVPPSVGSSTYSRCSGGTSTSTSLHGYLDDIDTSPAGVRKRVFTVNEPKDLLDFLAEDDRLCVVKVWAKWCRTCKVFDTRWRKVSHDESDVRDPGGNVIEPGRARFAEIEYTANEELCRGLNATRLPHVLMYRSMIKQAGFLSLPTGNFNHDVRALRDQVIEYSDMVVLPPPQNVPPPPQLGRTTAAATTGTGTTVPAPATVAGAGTSSATAKPLPPPWLTPRGADVAAASRPPGAASVAGAAVPPTPPAWAVARTTSSPPVMGGRVVGGVTGGAEGPGDDDDEGPPPTTDDGEAEAASSSVLRAELDRTSEELLSTRQSLRRAQTDLVVANGALADAERTVADYDRVRAEREGLKEEIRSLRSEVEGKVEEARKLVREEAEAAIDALRADFEAELAEVRKERDELAGEVGRLEGEVESAREEAERSDEALATLEAEAKLAEGSARLENELLREDLARVRGELEDAYEEVERGSNYTAELIADFEKVKVAAMEKESLEEDVAHLEEVLQSAQEELERSLNETATAEAEAKLAVSEKEDLEERMLRVEEEAREAVMAKEDLEKDLARMYGALQVSQEEVERNSVAAAEYLEEAESANHVAMEDLKEDHARMEERLDLSREEAERLKAEAEAARLENDVLKKDLARAEDALKLAAKDARRESYGTAKLKAKLAQLEKEAEFARTEKEPEMAHDKATGDSNAMGKGEADLRDVRKSPQIAGEALPIEEPRLGGEDEQQGLQAELDQVRTGAAQPLDVAQSLVGAEQYQKPTSALEADASKDSEEKILSESKVGGNPNGEDLSNLKLGVSDILQRRTLSGKKASKGNEQLLHTKHDATAKAEGEITFAWKDRRKVGMKRLPGRESTKVGIIGRMFTRKKKRRR